MSDKEGINNEAQSFVGFDVSKGNNPPAEPGAFSCEPLKAACLGPLTRPARLVPPEGGCLSPKLHLIQTLVLLFLVADVFAYHLLVSSHC